jgi:prepilin-type N-terminal cleavage/methylation domain-containing protein
MRLQNIRKNSQGFTLIEVLVSIVIMGVMAAITAPSFMTWLNNKKVDDVLAQIEGSVKEAQSTAIKKNTSCNVLVKENQITTVASDNTTEVPACLPSGWRTVSDSNSNIRIAGTGGGSGTIVKFSAKGTTLLTPTTQAVVIYRTDAPTNGARKCLVVSSGIGIVRTGNYIDSDFPSSIDLTAPNPLRFSNLTAPPVSEVNTVISRCISS